MVPHCTPEQLALAALREPLPADDATHLDSYARCRAELLRLQRGVDALALPELSAAGPGAVPAQSVWAGIAAATGVRTAPRPEAMAGPDPATEPAPAVAPLPLHRAPGRRAGRRSLRPLLAVAAAAVIGAGIALGAVAVAHRGPSGTTLAEAPLRALAGSGTAGTAVVVEHADHSLELDVTLRGGQPGSGYLEVWLADPGLARMVAVGVLRDGRGALALPAGLSIRSYPVVDVSDEPLDGDPAHSSDSVARGLLQ
jgi:Anti-sigma-K factor rskA